MERLKLEESNSQVILSLMRETLRAGKLVIAPTDTVYGILGRADDEETTKKIFAVKKRSEEKALPIFIKSVVEARRFAYISDAKAKFLETIWPGPVTAVFHHKEKLPKILTGSKDTIGMRIPNHQWLLLLLADIPFPLAQTSANISGEPPAKNGDEVLRYFSDSPNAPALLIDGGEITRTSSTVVDYTREHPLLIRAGVTTRVELERISRDLS